MNAITEVTSVIERSPASSRASRGHYLQVLEQAIFVLALDPSAPFLDVRYIDLSEAIQLTGQQRGLVFVEGKAVESSFAGQGNASVLFLRHFGKGLGLAPTHWVFGYALNVRFEKFSHLDACH